MGIELFIATRYLLARRKQTFIYIISLMSILGVALGVGALVVVLGVYNGFTTDIRDKILGANSHLVITSSRMGLFQESQALREKILAVPGIKAVTPFVYAEVMLSSPASVKGVIVRGIDPHTAPDVLQLLQKITSGSVADLNPVPDSPDRQLPGVIVGRELARRLGLVQGSRVNLLSPSGQKTSTGFAPRIRPFRVAGIFSSGMGEYDSSLGFVSLDGAREVLGLQAGSTSGYEATVNDVFEADSIARAVDTALGPDFRARSWMEMNANLFAALQLEKIGMFIILAMVVLIGSFSIVTSLVMLVMEKTRDIAILMSMGATKGMIRRIFMLQGTIIGFVGTILGYVGGVGLGLALQRYQFIKLPKGVYTVDHLPVLLRWEDMALIGASAMLLCFLATLYPAWQAASLKPSEALRYE